MRSGLGVDKSGLLPMSAEDARLYRTPFKQCQKSAVQRTKK